jgi:hypothetical protein
MNTAKKFSSFVFIKQGRNFLLFVEVVFVNNSLAGIYVGG